MGRKKFKYERGNKSYRLDKVKNGFLSNRRRGLKSRLKVVNPLTPVPIYEAMSLVFTYGNTELDFKAIFRPDSEREFTCNLSHYTHQKIASARISHCMVPFSLQLSFHFPFTAIMQLSLFFHRKCRKKTDKVHRVCP